MHLLNVASTWNVCGDVCDHHSVDIVAALSVAALLVPLTTIASIARRGILTHKREVAVGLIQSKTAAEMANKRSSDPGSKR
jgi:hypothetical protein